MTFWVYILECRSLTGAVTLYTGQTNNLARRLQEHATGQGARYTRGKTLELKYCEEVPTRRDAMRREASIKGLSKLNKIRLICGGHLRGNSRGPPRPAHPHSHSKKRNTLRNTLFDIYA